MKYSDVTVNEMYERRRSGQQAHELGEKVMVRALADGWTKAVGKDRGVNRSTLIFPEFNHTFEGTFTGETTGMVIIAVPGSPVTFELASSDLLTLWSDRVAEVKKINERTTS